MGSSDMMFVPDFVTLPIASNVLGGGGDTPVIIKYVGGSISNIRRRVMFAFITTA